MIKEGDTNDSYEESHLADKLRAGPNYFFLFSFQGENVLGRGTKEARLVTFSPLVVTL
jgi:hypothetical protein